MPEDDMICFGMFPRLATDSICKKLTELRVGSKISQVFPISVKEIRRCTIPKCLIKIG